MHKEIHAINLIHDYLTKMKMGKYFNKIWFFIVDTLVMKKSNKLIIWLVDTPVLDLIVMLCEHSFWLWQIQQKKSAFFQLLSILLVINKIK